MSITRDEAASVAGRFALPLYFVAGMLFLLPPLDILFGLPMIEWSSVRWRFGAAGLMTSALAVPTAGLLLGVIVASVARHYWMQRLLIAVGILTMFVLAGALGLFSLDAIQVRREVQPQAMTRFDVTVVKSVLTQLVQLLGFGLVVWAGIRARQRSRGESTVRSGETLVSSGRASVGA